MAYNSSGVYTRVDNSFSNPVVGTTISPTHADDYFDDIDAALNAYYGTSTTSLLIATGSKAFTTQTGKLFGVGRFVIAISAANPANYMFGQVTAYSSTTLTVNVLAIGGSGTLADWTIYICGAQGATGATGATGEVPTVHFNYSTTTSDADPGSGIFRLNNATLASATAAYFDNNERGGTAVSAWLDTFDDSGNATLRGYLYLVDPATPTTFYVFSVSGSVVDGTGYRKVTIAYLAGSGSFTNGNKTAVAFYSRGPAGTGDVTSTNNGSDFAQKYTTFDNLSVHGADVASATTTNLETATGNLVDVTGTTTITAITLSEGHERTVRFTGALILTHGASLVLPGSQNITTVAGDYAVFKGYAAGVVRCTEYTRGTSRPLVAGASTVASATTTDIGAVREESITISGTVTITSLGSSAPTGEVKFVQFSGALILTHNGTSLIIPGAANITTVAGDCMVARHEGSGNWRVLTYLRGAGRPLNSGTTDNLTVGYTATSFSAGTKSSGTFTPDPLSGNFQHATNGGAHTLAPPSATCSMLVEYLNNGSAGAVTTSGFTKVTGDTITTTNGSKFAFFITKTNSYSHLHVQALQ